MDNVNDFFATLSSFLWGWPMIVLLLGTHVFLTVRLRFPQRKLFTAIRISVQRDKSQKGDVSQFGALATALAATFVGSVANLTIVWNIADCMNALMAIPNLLSLIGLNGVIVHETRKYLWRNRLDREMND